MQPKPIAETVNAALPLPNVLCVRTAAILAGIVAPDAMDLPAMAFSAAVTFSNVGAMQIAALANTVRFKKPRRLISFSLFIFFVSNLYYRLSHNYFGVTGTLQRPACLS